jgi:hypothetical protein
MFCTLLVAWLGCSTPEPTASESAADAAADPATEAEPDGFDCPPDLATLFASLAPEATPAQLPPGQMLTCGARQGDQVPLTITAPSGTRRGTLRVDDHDRIVEVNAGGGGHLRVQRDETGRVTTLVVLSGPAATVHGYTYDEEGAMRQRAAWSVFRGNVSLREVVDLDAQGWPVQRRVRRGEQLHTVTTTYAADGTRTDSEPQVGPLRGLPTLPDEALGLIEP